MRHHIACILGNLSQSSDRTLDDVLVLNGIITIVQTMSIQLNRVDTICMLMMTYDNISNVIRNFIFLRF